MRILLIILILLTPSICFGEASRNLDGTGDRLGQGDIFNVTTGNVSVCGFHKLTEDASIDVIIGKKTTTGAGYSLQQTTGDLMTFAITGASGSVTSTSSTDVDATWIVSCGTWDGSNDISTLYINGTQEDQDDVTDRGSLTTAAFFRMGADGAATADYDGNGLWAYQSAWSGVILTAQQVNDYRWRPEVSGAIPDMLIPIWGDATEIDLSANKDTVSPTNTTVSSDGPPIMMGDYSS